MAVHTRLTSHEISNFLEKYKIGNLVSYIEIIEGIDNSNFILQTTQDKFILTVFENRIKKEELPFFIQLKLHLALKGICCPRPIAARNGDIITDIKGKPAAVVTFLHGKNLKPQEDGYYDNITTHHCAEVGKNLAKLHLAVSDFKLQRKNDLGVAGFHSLFMKMNDKVESYLPGLREEILGNISFLEKIWQSDLPAGAVHVDLFPDNVFFNEAQNLSGIIDFYFAANDLFIYDLAVVVNAWCFNADDELEQKKLDALMTSYQLIRAINSDEKIFLNIALLAASMRFLLTRLYDYFNTPKESLVKIKNPDEYLHKMRFWKEFLADEHFT